MRSGRQLAAWGPHGGGAVFQQDSAHGCGRFCPQAMDGGADGGLGSAAAAAADARARRTMFLPDAHALTLWQAPGFGAVALPAHWRHGWPGQLD